MFMYLYVEINKIGRLLCEDLNVTTSTCADWRWGWRRRRVYPAWAWADVPWHGQNKAFGFFTATLSIEAGVSGFTCFLFGGLCGQALWPLHLVGVSRRQRQSFQRRTAEGECCTPLVLPMNCVTTETTFHTYRSICGLLLHYTMTFALSSDMY